MHGPNKSKLKSKLPKKSLPFNIPVYIKYAKKKIKQLLKLVHLGSKKFMEWIHKTPNTRLATYGFGSLITLLLTIIAIGLFKPSPTQHEGSAGIKSNPREVVKDGLRQGTPKYKTIVPAGKTIQDFGGWTRVSPPDRNPVFAYIDHIGAIQINVSEQPLPEDFSTDIEGQVGLLAAGYSANTQIKAGKITVHIGTSAKGPQSVIFAKGNLLILIKSQAVIPNSEWITYIENLK